MWLPPEAITYRNGLDLRHPTDDPAGSIGVVGGKIVLGQALRGQGVEAHVLSVGGDSNFMDYWSLFPMVATCDSGDSSPYIRSI